MPKRISKNADPEKYGGKDQPEAGDFVKLLKTDIKDLEIADALKRLGNIQVNDWKIRRPKRAAKGSEKTALPNAKTSNPRPNAPDEKALAERLKNFLLYVATNLIEEPSRATIHANEISPGVLRLRLVLERRDLSMLVGRGGDTAEVIRNILKARGRENGVDVLLQIITHEENASLAKNHPKK